MERKKARDWYWWLWLSPLLTIPTLLFFYSQLFGYDLMHTWAGIGYGHASRISVGIGVLVSALWHLVLLGPIRNKESLFVRWHGRQALLLAGVRTAIPLAFGLAIGEDYEVLLFIPVQIVVWFGGTLWGQLQASRGKCSLARWFGQEELLPVVEKATVTVASQPKEQDVKTLVEIIRFSRDPAERKRAVEELTKRGMVEAL